MRLYETHVTCARPAQPMLPESAVSSPQNHSHYSQNDVFQLARILVEKIVLNHAFQDSNKRIALLTADMFLRINGYQLRQTPFGKDEVNEDLKNAHVAVASNTWTAEKLAEYCRITAKPVQQATSEIES
ncbi:hypothetical protein F5Y19DRAFT_493629 [Xylariaceae sp. FL1651]|nr:hypothetical protein F5Y19DRAFT_493629 [Xylariaceae sp. FL1651]